MPQILQVGGDTVYHTDAHIKGGGVVEVEGCVSMVDGTVDENVDSAMGVGVLGRDTYLKD